MDPHPEDKRDRVTLIWEQISRFRHLGIHEDDEVLTKLLKESGNDFEVALNSYFDHSVGTTNLCAKYQDSNPIISDFHVKKRGRKHTSSNELEENPDEIQTTGKCSAVSPRYTMHERFNPAPADDRVICRNDLMGCRLFDLLHTLQYCHPSRVDATSCMVKSDADLSGAADVGFEDNFTCGNQDGLRSRLGGIVESASREVAHPTSIASLPLTVCIDLTKDHVDEDVNVTPEITDEMHAQMLQRRFNRQYRGFLSGGSTGGVTEVSFRQDSRSTDFGTDTSQDAVIASALQSDLDLSLRQIKGRRIQLEHDAFVAFQLQADVDEHDCEQRRLKAAARTDDLFDVLALHRINIQTWLSDQAQQGFKPKMVVPNAYSQPGQPLYNRFVTAWERVADQTVVIAFHGTAEGNIDAICRTGLDPGRRTGQAMGPGEYFATNGMISVPYCKGGRRMLVVALLMDRSGLTANAQNIIVVNKPEHQLPLFIITF